MRVGIVIDSACDLPQAFIEQHQLEIMPINLRIGSELIVDQRDAAATLSFYKRYVEQRDLDAETQPYSVEQITKLFLDKLVLKYDRILVICITSSRSLIHENATKASFAILAGYKARRDRSDQQPEGVFQMRVLDSRTLFTGEAVLVHEAVRLLHKEQMPFDKLRPAVDELSKHVHAYLVPNDLFFVYNRGRKRGDRSVSWLQMKVGSMLDIKPILKAYRGETFPLEKHMGYEGALARLFEIALADVKKGLRTKVVAMSYAGNPEVVRKLKAYAEFVKACEKAGVETMLSVMSTTAGLNVGPGAFSLGYIGD